MERDLGLPPLFVGQTSYPDAVLPDLDLDAPPAAGNAPPSATLFVGNVDTNILNVEAVLLDLFTQMGDVLQVNVPREKGGGRLRGFAFCDFADPLSAHYALSVLNGLRVGSRNIRLEVKGGGPPPVVLPPPPTSARNGGAHYDSYEGRAPRGRQQEDDEPQYGRVRSREDETGDGGYERSLRRLRSRMS